MAQYLMMIYTDEAIERAAKIPRVQYGCVEVRPIMVFEQE